MCNISRGLVGELKPADFLHSILFEQNEDCLGVRDLASFYHSGAKYVTFEHVWYGTIVISENTYTSTRYFLKLQFICSKKQVILACNNYESVSGKSQWTYFNPLKPNVVSHYYQLDQSIFVLSFVGWIFFIFILILIITFCKKKLWRLWSDAAFCGVWSGYALFAYVLQNDDMLKLWVNQFLCMLTHSWLPSNL